MHAKTLTILILLTATALAQPTPVMEYASVLSGLRIRHKTGVVEFESSNHALASVFVPQGTPVTAVLVKKGSTTPLTQQPFRSSAPDGVFSRVSVAGAPGQYAVKSPGEYTAAFFAGRKLMTAVDFRVDVMKNDDEFQPKTHYYLSGPWQRWAYMYAPLEETGSTQPEFRMWVHKRSFADSPDADKYDVQLILNGDVVGVSSTGFTNSKEGQQLKFTWRHPESKGGRAMRVADLEGTNGTYLVVVKKNGEPFGVWPFVVKDGKPQLHARQSGSFDPRSAYIVPRVSGLADRAPGMVVFMERLGEAEAAAALASKSSATSPMQIDRDAWVWLPNEIDPNRPFQFTTTNIETRTDTGFDVGEDMVVFGTGIPNGVKYMLAGEAQAREIPEGETFSSKVFGVCGRKIVLTRRNQVFVFDTKTQQLSAIPETEISLYNPSKHHLNTSGYLVATVNKALAVKDRTIIKVIDVSGDQPKIIPIKNAKYVDSDVTGVAVDAKHGNLAIASRSKKLIAAAKIAPMADQYLYDMSQYRGVASFRIAIEDEDVTYVDEDWKVRRLVLTSKSPKAITQEPIGRSGNGYWVRKGRLVAVSKEENVGSRYRMLITDSTSAPLALPGTGKEIAGTSAHLGMGGSAAIAVDKTVFIAGTAGDSIGTGERLQILNDNTWQPILGNDGKPVWGSEVVTSMGFMAMKVRNAAGKTVIGYATYGQRIELPSGAEDQAKPSLAAANMNARSGPFDPLVFEKGSSFSTDDESEYSLLKEYLEVDQEVLKSLAGVFGEDGARKKIVEMTIAAMKSAGNEKLVDEFKRQSKLVPENEKPKAAAASAPKKVNVDPKEISKVLVGGWKALRFTAEGKDLPDAAIETLKMIFLPDGKYMMTLGGNVETGTYEFDSTVYPFGLTVNIGSGTNQGKKRRGSFKFLEDDRLIFVMATNDKDAPNKFVSSEENKNILAVYSKQ